MRLYYPNPNNFNVVLGTFGFFNLCYFLRKLDTLRCLGRILLIIRGMFTIYSMLPIYCEIT